jgi:hypothetical protein
MISKIQKAKVKYIFTLISFCTKIYKWQIIANSSKNGLNILSFVTIQLIFNFFQSKSNISLKNEKLFTFSTQSNEKLIFFPLVVLKLYVFIAPLCESLTLDAFFRFIQTVFSVDLDQINLLKFFLLKIFTIDFFFIYSFVVNNLGRQKKKTLKLYLKA